MTGPPTREAVAIVLDVSNNFSDDHFITAKETASELIQKKIFLSKADLVGLIFSGTSGTVNRLNTNAPSAYKHISVQKPLMQPDIDFVRTVEGARQEAGGNCDVLDSLVAAIDLIHESVGERRYARRIFFITAAVGTVRDKASLPQICETLKQKKIELIIAGINFPKGSGDLVDKYREYSRTGTASTEDWSTMTEKEQTVNVLAMICAESCPDGADDENDASGAAVSDVLPDTRRSAIVPIAESHEYAKMLNTRRVAQRPVGKCILDIGAGLSVATVIYIKTAVQPAPRYTRVGSKAEPMQTTRRHFSVRQMDVEIDAADRVKSLHYGRSIIPFNEVDQAQLKYPSQKRLILLGFTPIDSVPSTLFLGNCRVICSVPGDEVGAKVLSAFIRGMVHLNQAMVVRYVLRDGCDPVLGVAFPSSTAVRDVLHFVAVPFAEDLREMKFPTFSNIKFTQEETAAVEQMVEAMTPKEDQAPGGANEFDVSSPRDWYNPVSQIHYHIMKEKFKSNIVIQTANDAAAANNTAAPQQQRRHDDPFASSVDTNNSTGSMPAAAVAASNNSNDNNSNSSNAIVLPAATGGGGGRIIVPTVKPTVWNIPSALRRTSCCWGRQGNCLRDMIERSQPARQRVRELFPSESTVGGAAQTKKENKDYWYMHGAKDNNKQGGGAGSGKTGAGGQEEDDDDGHQPMKRHRAEGDDVVTGLGRAGNQQRHQQQHVTTVDPVRTFLELVKAPGADNVDRALHELGEVILHLLRVSIGSQYHERVFDALMAMRKVCVEESEPQMFNKFLGAVRGVAIPPDDDQVDNNGGASSAQKNANFWVKYVRSAGDSNKKIRPICTDECEESNIPLQAAASFLERIEPVVQQDDHDAPEPVEAEDDLYADLE